MRPWFTFIVTFILVVALLVLLVVVNFVLANRLMFEAKFDVVMPLPGWSHTWEGVQFMYILTGSMLLGALIIVITTLGLDTKRTLKLRSVRKELNQLQEALQKAQSLQETPLSDEKKEQVLGGAEESGALSASPSITPADITRSFEDTIQKGDFLGESKKSPADEQPEDKVEGSLEETPIEAELVENEETFAEENADVNETLKQEAGERERMEAPQKKKVEKEA